MAVSAPRSLAPVTRVVRASGPLRRIWVRLAAAHLDQRLAAGEDPRASAAFACRSGQLVSGRTRLRIANAVEHVCLGPRERALFSAVIPADGQAVQIARPALKQLAWALRSRESVQPGGVALTRLLLTDGTSALYRPAYPEALYEVARRALLALGTVGEPSARIGAGAAALVLDDQLGPR